MQKSKKILILGASSDIGIKVVEHFLKKNWLVIAHFNKNSKKLKKLKKLNNNSIELLNIDLRKIDKLKVIIKKKAKLLSNIDSYISLTGYLKNSRFEKLNLENFYNHLNVNFISNIFFINQVMKNMIKKKWGRILLSSSIGTKFGGSESTLYYSISKYMNQFIPIIFKKKYAKSILYNVIQIGVTDTKIHKKILKKKLSKRIRLIPVNRMATTEEISKEIYFLASEKNTYYHNQIINISGGE